MAFLFSFSIRRILSESKHCLSKCFSRKIKALATCCGSLKILYILTLLVTAVMLTMVTSYEKGEKVRVNEEEIPILYVITPTYDRPTQIPDLIRFMNTLLHVKNLHWIVVEDALNLSEPVRQMLNSSSIRYTYINAYKPSTAITRLKGNTQRNKGLSWIRQNHDPLKKGVVYIADDDNTYSVELFEMMRITKKCSIWPVGFISDRLLPVETPIVENGKIVGFYAWKYKERKFPVDMAGFAVNVKILIDDPTIMFTFDHNTGYQETAFLEQCCLPEELEPLADNCTKVLVWHTKTQTPHVNAKVRNHLEWNFAKLAEKYHEDFSRYRIKKSQSN